MQQQPAQQKTPEQIIKEQKTEIEALKKKLEDRNPAFNGLLLNRADSEYHRLCKVIAQAIASALGSEYENVFKGKQLHFYYESGDFGFKGCHMINILDKDQEKKVKEKITEIELKKFKDSLDNFSWIIQNGGQNA